MSGPLWRQVFDAAERAVAPRAEGFVRTPTFAVGSALVRRARTGVTDSAQGLTARAWHLVNLPAGSDISRLRAQVGALDREVRRLTVQLETERRRSTGPPAQPAFPEEPDADPADAESAGGARPRAPRRRPQRAAGT